METKSFPTDVDQATVVDALGRAEKVLDRGIDKPEVEAIIQRHGGALVVVFADMIQKVDALQPDERGGVNRLENGIYFISGGKVYYVTREPSKVATHFRFIITARDSTACGGGMSGGDFAHEATVCVDGDHRGKVASLKMRACKDGDYEYDVNLGAEISVPAKDRERVRNAIVNMEKDVAGVQLKLVAAMLPT